MAENRIEKINDILHKTSEYALKSHTFESYKLRKAFDIVPKRTTKEISAIGQIIVDNASFKELKKSLQGKSLVTNFTVQQHLPELCKCKFVQNHKRNDSNITSWNYGRSSLLEKEKHSFK